MASRGEMGRVSSGSAALFKILSHSAQMSALVFFTVQKKEGGGGGWQEIGINCLSAGMQRGVCTSLHCMQSYFLPQGRLRMCPFKDAA